MIGLGSDKNSYKVFSGTRFLHLRHKTSLNANSKFTFKKLEIAHTLQKKKFGVSWEAMVMMKVEFYGPLKNPSDDVDDKCGRDKIIHFSAVEKNQR